MRAFEAPVAELQGNLILERVKAGQRIARAKEQRPGRPKVTADARRIATLRGRGASWATVCGETGLSAREQRTAPVKTDEQAGPVFRR